MLKRLIRVIKSEPRRCGTCRHFRPDGDARPWGECWRFPPSDYQLKVHANNRCGEYRDA